MFSAFSLESPQAPMTPATMPLSTSAISDTSIQYILTAGGYVDMCMDGSWKGCFLFVDVTKGRIDIRQKRQSGLLGTITLRRFQLLERDSNAFDIATPNRTYRMKTRTTQSKESWMKTLLYLCEHQSEIDDFVKHVCVQTKSNGENILHWIDDHETDHCASCKKEFSFWRRRHHCRTCGFVFCSDDSCIVIDSKTCERCEILSANNEGKKCITDIVAKRDGRDSVTSRNYGRGSSGNSEIQPDADDNRSGSITGNKGGRKRLKMLTERKKWVRELTIINSMSKEAEGTTLIRQFLVPIIMVIFLLLLIGKLQFMSRENI